MHVLTWRRDWISTLWTIKSFYTYGQVDYPLFIHDGGLERSQVDRLRAHFPDAQLVPRAEALTRVTADLEARGLYRSAEFRRTNPFGPKLLDYYLFSGAERVLTLDSDILFFRHPAELVDPPTGRRKNQFNRDCAYWYTASPEELEACFGVRPTPRFNAGLSLIWVESLNFRRIEEWLGEPILHRVPWLTEQTIHALASTLYGGEHLPETYCVGPSTRPLAELVCKHYSGEQRPYLYEEGMRHLLRGDFLAKQEPAVAGDSPRAL